VSEGGARARQIDRFGAPDKLSFNVMMRFSPARADCFFPPVISLTCPICRLICASDCTGDVTVAWS